MGECVVCPEMSVLNTQLIAGHPHSASVVHVIWLDFDTAGDWWRWLNH